MWKKGKHSALLVGMQTGAATVENSLEFPQKKKKRNGSAFDPVIPLLGMDFKNTERIYAPPIPSSVIYNSQGLETAQVSTSR